MKGTLMHYGWKRRSDIPRRPYWSVLVFLLLALAVILLGAVWEVSRADADSASPDPITSLLHPAAIPIVSADTSPDAQLEASRKDSELLRQQLADAQLQIQQGNAALIAANEKVQTLQGEVAAAAQKLAEAKADRAEAFRVAGRMWEDWRQLKQQAKAVCAELTADKKSTPGNPDAAEAACVSATNQE